MDAFLQEPRGKIGYVVKRANQKSKVDWSNAIAKRCQLPFLGWVVRPGPSLCDGTEFATPLQLSHARTARPDGADMEAA
jgi:hypothetical protein